MTKARFFYDFEFFEDGKHIHPISIGMVTEDESDSYYAEFADTLQPGPLWDMIYNHSWLKSNVLPHLENSAEYYKPTIEIRKNLLDFVGKNSIIGLDVEFWAAYGAYDHVVMAQIFGTMMDLPHIFPMCTMDLAQLSRMKGDPVIPKQAYGKHNALADAKHNLQVFKFLTENNIPIDEEWL